MRQGVGLAIQQVAPFPCLVVAQPPFQHVTCRHGGVSLQGMVLSDVLKAHRDHQYQQVGICLPF